MHIDKDAGAAQSPDTLLWHSEERFRQLVEGIEDYAIFMLDLNGVVQTWNRGARKIKGWAAHEIIGRPFTLFYPPAALEVGWPIEELRLARERGRFHDEGWRLRKDGQRFWASVTITCLRDEQGQPYGFAKVTRDLTSRKQQEEELRRSEERFRLLADGVKDYAIVMLDPQGRIESWNAGATAITGYLGSDILGRHFSVFHTAQDVQSGHGVRELAKALQEGRAEDEGWRMRRDGSVFWAHVVTSPVYEEDGRLRGFAQVTRDMSESRRLLDLEKSSRRMSEFLAMLAHELRNPLAPIRNAVSIMQLEPMQSPTLRRCRDIIDRQLSYLTRLVDDLLDVGRIATGKMSLRREPVSFRDVVQRSVETVRPLIEARRHRLSIELPPEPVEVMGDDTRLVQVIQNLLTNAAKYTEDGGSIGLQVTLESETVVASVTDNGRGIAPDALPKVFDLFVQGGSGSPSESGLGIGLTLARTLVEMHGGVISAQSAGPGAGSTFTVRLPRLAPQAQRAAAGLQPPDDMPRGPSVRTLVVDDNVDSADTMVHVLALMGHEAVAVYDGEHALRVAAEFKPEVVLLDLNMPGSNGFSVVRQLRERPATHPLYIAAMTGYGQPGDREKTAALGFDAHLTKPVEVGRLGELFDEVVRRRA
ncbi:PAS domain-containing hybrid sensor histidine kinase/response regulator [Eleftheria terrae]|uniref:PAS domain-containing hybrid sensor histidine kinase/response regulator n=1 Tax=Eleftheria terrae TaxID=1597781 RepID=UPI00263B5698|nr:PAS domain S-box protein [Eleftheria terrae]WKB54455.1 PAS domain S-box protein [Eleftheria terrae]